MISASSCRRSMSAGGQRRSSGPPSSTSAQMTLPATTAGTASTAQPPARLACSRVAIASRRQFVGPRHRHQLAATEPIRQP